MCRNVFAWLEAEQAWAGVVVVVVVRAGSLRAQAAQLSSMRRQVSDMSVKGRNVIATLVVEQARSHGVVVVMVVTAG